MFGGIGLLLLSLLSLTLEELLVRDKLSCFLPSCENWRLEFGLVLAITSVLLVDWSMIGRLVKEVFKKSNLLESAAVVSVAVALVGGLLMILRWAERFPTILLILKFIGFTMLGVAMAFLIGGLGLSAWRSFKDARALRAISFSSTLARSEIARIFSGFGTPHGRIRFVRALERERITATGDWPADFKLSVGQGEPICALARLEERWLRLDR